MEELLIIFMSTSSNETTTISQHHYGDSRRLVHLSVAMMNWKPIETAPKDGKLILLRGKDEACGDGYWLKINEKRGTWVWAYVKKEPLWWMPIPPLDKKE